MQETDCDCFDRLFPQRRSHSTHRRLVELQEYVAARVETFRNVEAEVPRNERRGLFESEVVQARPHLPRELEHVAKASGRYEARVRRLALNDRVFRDGGGVHDKLDL